jgi:hypothetical protein
MCQENSISDHIEVNDSDSDDALRQAARRGTSEALRKVAEASAQHVWDEAQEHERTENTSRSVFIEEAGKEAMHNAPQKERDAMEEYLFLVLRRRRAMLMSRN